ncbi:MAG: helix-turn-helix domain-containing protein [Chloroflexi bacterium]|nr:helix-turn-helix domain-containing protein [Chloroflexota bacterium]
MPRKKMEEQKIEPIILTFTEAHEFLRVSHQTIYKLMAQGLPSHKIGKKRVFLKEDLIRWIKEH